MLAVVVSPAVKLPDTVIDPALTAAIVRSFTLIEPVKLTVTLLFDTVVTKPFPPSKVNVSVNKPTESMPVSPAIDKFVAILAVVTPVTKPLALTEITGIAVADP